MKVPHGVALIPPPRMGFTWQHIGCPSLLAGSGYGQPSPGPSDRGSWLFWIDDAFLMPFMMPFDDLMPFAVYETQVQLLEAIASCPLGQGSRSLTSVAMLSRS